MCVYMCVCMCICMCVYLFVFVTVRFCAFVPISFVECYRSIFVNICLVLLGLSVSVRLSVRLSVCFNALSNKCFRDRLSVFVSAYMPTCLFIGLISAGLYLCVCLSVCLPACVGLYV